MKSKKEKPKQKQDACLNGGSACQNGGVSVGVAPIASRPASGADYFEGKPPTLDDIKRARGYLQDGVAQEEWKKKSCFWCKKKGHYGINCKKRPKTLVDAYMLGQKEGTTEGAGLNFPPTGIIIKRKKKTRKKHDIYSIRTTYKEGDWYLYRIKCNCGKEIGGWSPKQAEEEWEKHRVSK